MITTRFEPITVRRTRRGLCPICGRPATRTMTFEQTVSPFNRNSDGSVRTRHEVWLAVNAEADFWTDEIAHASCATRAGRAS